MWAVSAPEAAIHPLQPLSNSVNLIASEEFFEEVVCVYLIISSKRMFFNSFDLVPLVWS